MEGSLWQDSFPDRLGWERGDRQDGAAITDRHELSAAPGNIVQSRVVDSRVVLRPGLSVEGAKQNGALVIGVSGYCKELRA